MTATAWMAQVPVRTDAEGEADRDHLLSDLKAPREQLEQEERRRQRAPVVCMTHDTATAREAAS